MYEDKAFWMVSVKALIADGDKVLLLKRHSFDGSLFWDLPGGCADNPDDDYQATLERELDEEIGYSGEIKLGPIIGVQRWHVPESGYPPKTTLVFVVHLTERLETLQLSDEHADHKWIQAADLEAAGRECRFEPELADLLERFFAGRY